MSTELTNPATSGLVTKTGIVLATMDEIWRFAETVIASGMAPKGINNPAAATIVIQMGMELGLPPMASLQNIAPINGRPSIWGDAMLGVVRATHELDKFEEWYELNGARVERTPTDYQDGLTAVCRVTRRGYSPAESSFSVADAKRAKLWSKPGPWTEYPSRMMKMRARSYALRDSFGDALRGLYSAEEERDLRDMRDVTPRNTEPPKVVTGGGQSPAPAEKATRTRKGATEAAATEVAEVETTSAATPPRMQMVAEIKEAIAAAGLKTAEAQTLYRQAGVLDAGKSMSDTSDKELYAIHQVRAAALQTQTEGDAQ